MSLYDDASLIMYPSGYKANKIYSLKPTNGSGDFDFTRASTATRVNADGLIESVASGVPRIDYTGGGCGKLLLEPQRTNKQTNSEQINTTNYPISSEISVTANTGTAPDGAATADKIIPTTTSAYHQVQSDLASANGFDFVSVFVKASG